MASINPTLYNCTMLIVEDDPDARSALRGMLKKIYPLLTLHDAGDGRAGLELFQQLRPELVMTDIRMPETDGIRMAREILKLAPRTQIVVITAHSDTDLLLDSIRIGINHYLLKPIDHRHLFEAVDDCLRRILLERTVAAQQEELRESEARYRGLFSSLQEGFSLYETIFGTSGVDHRIIDVNPAFERLIGKGRSELAGRTIREVFPDLKGEWLDCMAQVAATGQPATLEHYAAASDSYAEVQVYSPAKGQIAVLYSDVSERRKLQIEREKSERLESLGVLAGGIAHDFNNILMAIAGNISLARMQLDKDHKALAGLEESERAVAKAAGLTRQFLTFARGGDPIKKPLPTALLIREAVSLFLSGTNCEAQLELPEQLWCLYADSGQMHQALNNLIVNAIQAMPGGGVLRIGAANETLAAAGEGGLAPGRYLRIVIADQGVGIPAALLPKIFDPYVTTKMSGSGLGLASVFAIVKRHNGAISATSPPGGGASFELLLPASDEGCHEEAEAPLPVPASASGADILVMDDEEMIRRLAALMLEKLGYRAATCRDGAEAVCLYRESLARGGRFAAVILDITVRGGMGGWEAARRIRAIDADAVLVISSGYSADPFPDGESGFKVNGMVAKPYNLKQLAEELARTVNPLAGRGGSVEPGDGRQAP